MKKSLKIAIVALLVIMVLGAGVAAFVTYLAARSPERVTATVQHQLQKNLGVPVTIGTARFEWKRGPRVILSQVHIDSPGVINLHMSSITAYISLIRLVFGDVAVSKIRLIMPKGTIDLDNLKDLKILDETGDRPAVLIWKGTVKLIYQGVDLQLTELSGRVTSDWANLRARTMGGRVLLEADLARPGMVTFNAHAVQLCQLDRRLEGVAHVGVDLEDTPEGRAGSCSLRIKGLRLPWMRAPLEQLNASASVSSGNGRMTIRDLSIKTPVVEISGRGTASGITDLDSWTGVMLDLEASSREFDYEKVVSLLPVDSFPPWLKDLLTAQIRGGRSRFSAARYQGPLGGFFSGVELLDNLHVVQELKGQSFSAGYTPDRVTGITGEVIYGKGDIRFRNLSGQVGDSRLGRVDIVFPGAVRPLMRVGVDVELDMPAADFLRAWRASMVPGEPHRLLGPVSRVKEGRIKGKAMTYYDEARKNPFMARGNVRLDGCTCTWGPHEIAGMSGTISAESFSAPLRIILAGQFDRSRIRRLDARLSAPFGESRSRFVLLMDQLRPQGRVTLDDAALKVEGSGKGRDLRGAMDLRAAGVTVAQEERTWRVRSVSAAADFRLRLAEKNGASLEGLVIRSPSSRLEGTVALQGDDGSARLTGRIDLRDVSVNGATGTRVLGGSAEGELALAWGSEPRASGAIALHHATLPLQDDMITLDGSMTVRSPRISFTGLQVRSGEVLATLSGEVLREKQPFFTGDVTVQGLHLDGKGAGFSFLKDIRADAGMHFNECVIYGLPVQSARADATLDQGLLKLEGLVMETVWGSARGTAQLALDGPSSFDVTVKLQDSDLKKLLEASGGTMAMDGLLDVDGRLWGGTDSLNGTLAVTAKHGEIRRYKLLSQIFSLLNVYRISQTQDIDFLSRHFTYNRIHATLNIRDNVVNFDDLSLDSNSIQASAVGTYTLGSKKIDASIGVQPLETIDRAVSMIPVVGWVLAGDKGRFIVLSMKVSGTLDDPMVMVAPIDTLSNTVAASLLRSLRLPGRLIDESLQLINGKKQ
ncbi:MAG TPA: AsmA-like C-terminal domain-containing protein [Deltaproteobacteria bacterium]|nr:AsmA-like C-terminal domain-containing protein [Deltaproteobacteria bacterium]